MDWAQEVGKSNGFVTNTRITHATPAALYAHSASRYWEDDSKMPKDGAESCKDIAKQLIEEQPGKDIKVLLGGGKRHLVPRSDDGAEGEHSAGRRTDGRNLIDEWIEARKSRT